MVRRLALSGDVPQVERVTRWITGKLARSRRHYEDATDTYAEAVALLEVPF